ncbi:MAG: hypothetical protein N2C12_08545, partial [Planctomycetales bacterium]
MKKTVVKTVLAVGAFFSGLVVAQNFHPISADEGRSSGKPLVVARSRGQHARIVVPPASTSARVVHDKGLTSLLDSDRNNVPEGSSELPGQFVPLLAAVPDTTDVKSVDTTTVEAKTTASNKKDSNSKAAAKRLIAAVDTLLSDRSAATTANKILSDRRPTESQVAPYRPRFSAEQLALRGKIKQALDIYRNRDLHVGQKSAWSIMHSLIAYGVEKTVVVDNKGNLANAIGWICYNKPCRGIRLFY